MILGVTREVNNDARAKEPMALAALLGTSVLESGHVVKKLQLASNQR
jgi:hypothetical protein